MPIRGWCGRRGSMPTECRSTSSCRRPRGGGGGGRGRVAPEKDGGRVEAARDGVKAAIAEGADAKARFKSAPSFAPAGQSTQMIVGADAANDVAIVGRAAGLYDRFRL